MGLEPVFERGEVGGDGGFEMAEDLAAVVQPGVEAGGKADGECDDGRISVSCRVW
jgi:hypothetical protein